MASPHRALTIPDVLHEVFKYFATHPWLTSPSADLATFDSPTTRPSGDSQANCEVQRRTLAHAARTCRAFAEPASRVLWEVQHGLGPIVSVLKNAQASDEDGNALDWVRFEHIARRIRALFFGHGLNCDVDILALICVRYDGRSIFPNLRALFCGVQPLGVALLTCLCASPALVLVNTLQCNPTVVDTLVVVSDARPEIGHLHALCLSRFDEDSHRALAKFNNLQSAQFGLIDNALFCHLGTLPNLQMLLGSFDISDPDMGTEAAFPALQELIVESEGDDGGFRAALPFISSKSLAILSLRIEVELTEEMLEYLAEICASPALAHLSELDFAVHIGFNQWDNQEEPFEGVSLADVLPSLQRLRGLKVITILVEFVTSTVAGFNVEDRDIKAIASTWPDLVSLKVGHFIEHDDWPGGPEGIGRPSLSAVVSLAERCRKLEEVDVEFESVDAHELERLEASAAACAAPQTELRQIVVGPGCTDFCQKLRLADPTRAAAALRTLFPNVVSGLEMLGGGTEEGSAEAVRYRGWHPEDIETDMFRLLKGLDLEDVHLDG